MSDKQEDEIVIRKKHIIITLAIFAVILIGSVALTFCLGDRCGKGDMGSSAPELDIDPGASSWNGQQNKDEEIEEVGIKISGYPSITIPADTKTVTMALINPEGNPCYFKFELMLKDTGELLYESKLVPPGDAITEITMSKALPAGEYDATIKISTLSLDGTTALNGANEETVLIAEEN